MFELIECDRSEAAEKFLKKAGYNNFEKQPINGDASNRSFTRLKKGKKSFIFMDSNPTKGEEPLSYAVITSILDSNNIKVPEIIREDIEQGFFILEDFGNNLLSSSLEDKSLDEIKAYKEAIDIIISVQKIKVDSLTSYNDISCRIMDYDVNKLISEARIFIDWYIPQISKRRTSFAARDEFVSIMRGILFPVTTGKKVFTLRDYHCDNIMVLPNDNKIELGLLDFQDAVMGNPAYDIVSILQDARRKVSQETEEEILDYYIKKSKIVNVEKFKRDYLILGAQRNIKILGIFARIFSFHKDDSYLPYLPTVWDYLEKDLSSEFLKPLKDWFDRWLPESLRQESLAG